MTSSKTLTDNIFYSNVSKKISAANFAATISDHLTQSLAIPRKETSILSIQNIMKQSFTDFDARNFKNELKEKTEIITCKPQTITNVYLDDFFKNC